MADVVKRDGIAGVDGYEPVGASVQIGIKADRGFPIEKDRFHIMEPRESGDQRRRPHPSFGWYNQASVDKRRVIRGVIAHGSWSACLEQHLMAYRVKGHDGPPSAQPWCIGDGVNASRYNAERGIHGTIPCPNEKCAFRQQRGKLGPECKPTTRLLFRLDFTPEIVERFRPPTPIVRFTSGGWRTYRGVLGIRQALDAAARDLGEQMGLDGPIPYSPLGLRFTLTVTEGRSSSGGQAKRFPYVVASLEESAVDFVMRAYQTRQAFLANPPQVAALTDDTMAEDVRAITVRGEG